MNNRFSIFYVVTLVLFFATAAFAYDLCPYYEDGVNTGTIDNNNLTENSGIGASLIYDDVFYGLNDSGEKIPRVFAFNAAGEDLGEITLGGEGNPGDWEDLCTGPGPEAGASYIYIGEIGDNAVDNGTYSVFRVKGPATEPTGSNQTIPSGDVEEFKFRYDASSKSYNAECLMIDPSSKDLYIVTKNAGFHMFRFPYPQNPSITTTLDYLGRLPEFVTEAEADDYVAENKVTGGDMTATEMVLRSTKRAWYWEKGSQTWDQIVQAGTRGIAIASANGDSGGEAICFDSSGDLYSLPEGQNRAIRKNARIDVAVSNDSQFISYNGIPSFMQPGSTAQVSVTMKNIGTDTWSSGAGHKLGSGNPRDNTTWGMNRVQIPSNIAPDNQGTFTFTITAPMTPGFYDFQWQMVDDVAPNNGWFGELSDNVMISVGVTNLANSMTHSDDCGGLQSGKEIGYIHDGDVESSTAKAADNIWVEYDFGGNYTLSSARIFGDNGGGWNSQSWTLQTWNGSSYVDQFTSEGCYGTEWFEQALAVTTTKAKVIVNGTVDGTEVFEVQIIGTEITQSNVPPYFTTSPTTAATEDSLYSYTPQANDVDGDSITITAETTPTWLTFSGDTLSGTPDNGDIGTYSVTLRATDKDGFTDQIFNVEVSSIPEPDTSIQHLDGSIAASVTGSPVTQWADQSGNGNHALAADGTVLYPSSSLSESGLPGVDMGADANSLELFSDTESDAWLDFDGSASGNSGFAVLIAFKCDNLMTSSWNDVIGNSSVTASGFGMRYSTGGAPQIYLGGATITGSTAVQGGDSVVFAFNYDASGGSYTFWDSKSTSELSASIAATNFSVATPVTVGRTTNSGRYMDGMIGEVLVFDTLLTTQEFQDKRDTLVAKWIDGISNLPPVWDNDPITKENGQVTVPYSGSLSADASDPESDPLTFSKIDGVSWLTVASTGALSGTPDAVGLNWATVTVSDGINTAVPVTVNILVGEAPLEGYDAWAADESVDPVDLANLLEYALDGDTTVYGDSEPVLIQEGGTLKYIHPQHATDSNLSYEVQICTDLTSGNWTNVGYTITGTNVTGGTYNEVTNSIPTTGAQSYIRLKIQNN